MTSTANELFALLATSENEDIYAEWLKQEHYLFAN
jgi:hypothetical protein